jgi:hypothetical protein
MKMIHIAVLVLQSGVFFGACAQVPESGRWQELSFSAEQVDASMEDRYIGRTVDLAAAGKLDEDRALMARLRAISPGLIRAAVQLKPEAAQWQWEIHTTSDPEVDAICMSGGKILVGSAFVRQLDLNDGELATLLAHEVAHAVAEHHRETFSEALFLNRFPAVPLEVVMERLDSDLTLQIRLSTLSSLQESEADQRLRSVLPQHVAAAMARVWPCCSGRGSRHARTSLPPAAVHEHQVRQAVHILARMLVDGLGLAQRDDGALGAAAHGAAHMRLRRGARSGRQDEFRQCRQVALYLASRCPAFRRALR